MSYNLMAEGDLDLFELSQAAHDYAPLELFPIPADPEMPGPPGQAIAIAPDALGIAIPSSRVGPAATAVLRVLIDILWTKGAAVFDLYTGKPISTQEELAELEARVLGPT